VIGDEFQQDEMLDVRKIVPSSLLIGAGFDHLRLREVKGVVKTP
jgi:hypothetical protein